MPAVIPRTLRSLFGRMGYNKAAGGYGEKYDI